MKAYDTFIVAFAMMSFVILGWVTVNGSSAYHKNAEELEDLLEMQVADALVASGFDWVAVEMDGQYATLYGVPPNEAAASAAEEVALTAAGNGGWLRGGITRVVPRFEAVRPTRELLIGKIEGPQHARHMNVTATGYAVLAVPSALRKERAMANQRFDTGFQDWSE